MLAVIMSIIIALSLVDRFGHCELGIILAAIP